jgi:hypothetical protein
MKTNTRCKYGHKMVRKQNKITRIINSIKNFDYDKAGVITVSVAFVSYCLYLDIIK